MRQPLILSPFVWNPRECRGDVAVFPSFGPPCKTPKCRQVFGLYLTGARSLIPFCLWGFLIAASQASTFRGYWRREMCMQLNGEDDSFQTSGVLSVQF